MKKIVQVSIALIVLFSVIFYRNEIVNFIVKNFFFNEGIIIETKNKYALNYEFLYMQETNDFYAKTKQHLYNIIYTGLNNGNREFEFFCDYDKCRDDLGEISKNNLFLDLNNFIHPFNSFYKLYISITGYDKVIISTDKSYDEATISKINTEITKIEEKVIKDSMNVTEKIKAIHDYIINITDYDTDYVLNNLDDAKHTSHNATGPLFYNKALCGGYTDIMSIYLNKLNIPNYRISSEDHIWNLVYINNQWLHLDLTWDDPVVANNAKILIHKFFLISSKDLESLNTGYHTYNKEIYLETT